MTNRQVETSWQQFRFALRYATREYAPSHCGRADALPLTAPNPEQIMPILRSVLATLELLGHEGEESPVLRTAKKLLRPSPAHRARKELAKNFESYRSIWNETHALAAKV